jgi:hypothetical protein
VRVCRSIAAAFLNVARIARDLLEDRLCAITDAIAAFGSDSKDTPHPS